MVVSHSLLYKCIHLCSPAFIWSKILQIQWHCKIISWNLKSLLSPWIYFKMLFIPVMAKLNFQQPLLQSSVWHDPSEIRSFSGFFDKEVQKSIIYCIHCVSICVSVLKNLSFLINLMHPCWKKSINFVQNWPQFPFHVKYPRPQINNFCMLHRDKLIV